MLTRRQEGRQMPDVPDDLGIVIGVFTCPGCGEDLRLEERENLHHEYVVAICPDECWCEPLRVGGQLELDSGAEKRKGAGYCLECQDQIIDEDYETVEYGILHTGECHEQWLRDQQMLSALGGGDDA